MSDRKLSNSGRVDLSTPGALPFAANPNFSIHSNSFPSKPKGETFGGLGEFRPDLGLNLGIGYRTSADGKHTVVFAFKFDPRQNSPAYLTSPIKDEVGRFIRKFTWPPDSQITIRDEVGSAVNNPRPWKTDQN